MSSEPSRLITRRRFVRGAALTGLTLLAAACGSTPSPTPPPGTATPGGSPSPGGRTPSPPSPEPSATPGASATPLAPPSPEASATPGPTPGRARRSIASENRRPGTDTWSLSGGGRLGAEGFAGAASVEPGDRLALHLGGIDGAVTADVEWYRLGWYGGSGGRLVRRDTGVRVRRAGAAVRDEVLGRAEAPYAPAVTIDVPDDWASGMHVAVLRPSAGGPAYVPFVLRAPLSAQAPILFVSAMATWHAYDAWGGKSLYGYNSGGTPSVVGARAAQVSFDRPFAWDRGAGLLRRWEIQFVRWLERNGYDADYAADVDLELHPEMLAGRRLVVFCGHPEYWSRPMRDAVQRTVDAGTNVAFITANEVYWQVRLEGSPVGPGRRITCYKSAKKDPVTRRYPRAATARWRERPIYEPEAALVGQMYGHVVARPADWVVDGARHWLYRGTGVRDGDRFVNLVGQEYDTFFADLAPAGTEVLARSPLVAAGESPGEVGNLESPPLHTATTYTARSGATVFAAGTFQWSWAIDDYGERAYHGIATPLDPRVERMTRNLLERLGRE